MAGFCIVILLFLAFCYTLMSVLLFIGVWRLKRNPMRSVVPPLRSATSAVEESENSAHLPFVSILVSARNEERCIASCLESLVQQHYPSDKFEIVVINDRSTDGTSTIIKGYQEKYKTIKYINIDFNSSGLTGKQNAINKGLKFCSGEIILNTDADCIAGPLWIRRTVSYFRPVLAPGRASQIDLTIGFSTTYSINGCRSFFSDLQSLDMLFLMDAAAGAVGMRVPVSCLGRNLAYKKYILDDIGYSRMGYAITEDAALIQAVGKDADKSIAVAYDRDASVLTSAEENVKQLLSQRIRWILGGQAGRSWTQIPLYFIFLFHLCLAICFPLMFLARSFTVTVLLSVFVKTTLDFIRCWRVCKEFKRLDLLRLFVPYEIFMVSYSVLAGFGSAFTGKVRWKGEVYNRNARRIHVTQ